tara:strand:+ start:32 stop:874 length:843 start_codon:yes stop_codon:yes gene_type:complete
MNKALGKGLEALIKTNDTEESTKYLSGQLPIEKIFANKNQPRTHFDQSKMEELIASIKEKGIIQPLTVKEHKNGTYEIIAGERRYRAAKAAGLKWVPAYTITLSNDAEMMEYALIENIQRVDLNPIEEAEGYAILSGKHNLSHQDIAKKVSKSRAEISNKLRLLKLPPVVKESLKKEELSYGHARALLALKESKKIIKIFYSIINQKLSVRDTEKIIKNKPTKSKKNKSVNSYRIDELENKLQNYLSSKVKIKARNHKGSIDIEFETIEELEDLVRDITQ